jgi:hypothetical protein
MSLLVVRGEGILFTLFVRKAVMKRVARSQNMPISKLQICRSQLLSIGLLCTMLVRADESVLTVLLEGLSHWWLSGERLPSILPVRKAI